MNKKTLKKKIEKSILSGRQRSSTCEGYNITQLFEHFQFT